MGGIIRLQSFVRPPAGIYFKRYITCFKFVPTKLFTKFGSLEATMLNLEEIIIVKKATFVVQVLKQAKSNKLWINWSYL